MRISYKNSQVVVFGHFNFNYGQIPNDENYFEEIDVSFSTVAVYKGDVSPEQEINILIPKYVIGVNGTGLSLIQLFVKKYQEIKQINSELENLLYQLEIGEINQNEYEDKENELIQIRNNINTPRVFPSWDDPLNDVVIFRDINCLVYLNYDTDTQKYVLADAAVPPIIFDQDKINFHIETFSNLFGLEMGQAVLEGHEKSMQTEK